MIKRWLMGFVQNIYSEFPSQLVLIIAGEQNTGKTYFLRNLLPKRLYEYLGESQHDREKDDDLLMTQKLLILDDEFSGKSKQDAKKMKRLSSASYFDLRPPYGEENVRLKRIAVLAGTCNETEILNDPTGNRRFIVFEVNEQMVWDVFNEIDKDQLFAQIKSLWDEGFTGDLTSKEINELKEETFSKYSEVSLEEELLIKFFDSPTHSYHSMSNSEIKMYIEMKSGQKLNTRKLGLELKKLGYQQKTIRRNDQVLKAYTITQKKID
jgi:predicted P-loop ATPase